MLKGYPHNMDTTPIALSNFAELLWCDRVNCCCFCSCCWFVFVIADIVVFVVVVAVFVWTYTISPLIYCHTYDFISNKPYWLITYNLLCYCERDQRILGRRSSPSRSSETAYMYHDQHRPSLYCRNKAQNGYMCLSEMVKSKYSADIVVTSYGCCWLLLHIIAVVNNA